MRVIRDGVASDRLDRSQLKLAPTDDDQRRFFYHPFYSLQSALVDVRVGDVVEFAYSVEGESPLRKGKCFELFPTQWDVPIGRNVLRFAFPSQRKIVFRPRNQPMEPVISTEKGVTEYLYDSANVPGLDTPDDVPDDYVPRGQLQVSDFDSWAEVVQWALPLFEFQAPHSQEFTQEVVTLRAIAEPEQRVVAALEFVQRELSYIGIDDFGPAAHRPTPLDDVLGHRFADYKDKVILLIALLRATGIDAAPALVSYNYRGLIRDFLPSARPFDHAIVQIRLNQTSYWLEAEAISAVPFLNCTWQTLGRRWFFDRARAVWWSALLPKPQCLQPK